MLVYISSGNSVDEVCRALWHFKNWLDKNYQFEVLKEEYTKREEGYKSLLLQTEDKSFKQLQGTHLWKAQSPFRPKHKRKNWYFTLICLEEEKKITLDESKIIYQTMKSPKKGGQHTNTTCSGVRAIYPPLNLEAISHDERSQHQNKRIAKARLYEKLITLETSQFQNAKNQRWKQGKEVIRGDAIKVFENEDFKEKRQ